MKCTKVGRKGFYLESHWVLMCLFVLTTLSNTIKAQQGIKIGTMLSNFYYTGGTPVPYKGYDVDLRPYLGYDMELAQLNPQKPLFSLYVSVYQGFKMTNKIGFQSALSFAQKGANFSQSDYEKIIYKVKINYLEIPLSFSYQIVQKEKVCSDIYFGGYGSYRLNAHKNVTTHHNTVETIKVNTVNNFDWGVHLGGKATYRIMKDLLLLDLRFFIGLKDIFTAPDDWTAIYFETHKTKITGLNLSVGYEL